MTEAQKCLYHIAENMRMDKSISKEGYEYFQQAIKALEQEPQTDEIILSKKEYRELLSDEFEHGYDKGLSDAITSLEQEPCNDAISRQAAIDCLNADFTIDGKENMETVVDYINGAFKQIKALPSVTPQPFINKPCVSEGVCREDKIQVLDKIRAEIDSYCSDNRDRNDGLYIAMRIIDKYKEREDKE